MTRDSRPRRLFHASLALGLFVLLPLGAGCSASPASGQVQATADTVSQAALMERGLGLLKAGDGAGAVAVYRELLRVNPTHYGAKYQLARALDEAGQPVEARRAWEQMLTVAQAGGDSSSVATAKARLAQPDTVSQAAMMAAGMKYLRTEGELALAVQEFSKLLERNPAHYGAHYQIAVALDRYGQPAEARKWWVKLQPMATKAQDAATLATIQTRLQQTP